MVTDRKKIVTEQYPDSRLTDFYFKSDYYEIKNWSFDFVTAQEPGLGYNDCLCMMFVQKGNFLFDISRQAFDLHTGYVLIDKPDYEYRLHPAAGYCSIFNFSADFYRKFIEDLNLKGAFFFSNPSLLSLMLKTTPEMEYLYYQLLRNAGSGKLEKDNLVIELLEQVIQSITPTFPENEFSGSLKKYHLVTIEKAKEYIHEHFFHDISLFEISSFACVSPFHFSRIFKKFTAFSPHQYLQNIRIKHGEILLKTSALTIGDVAFQAGFSTAEYFATAFRQRYKQSPTDYRKRVAGW